MKLDNLRTHVRNTFSTILVVIIGITFYFCLKNFNIFFNGLNFVLGILSPIIYGVVIAYLLSPVCNFFDKIFRRSFLKQIKDSKKAIKVSNTLSTVVSFFIFVLILILIFWLIVPQLAVTISNMAETLPDNINNMLNNMRDMVESNPFLNKSGIFWSQIINYVRDFFKENVMPHLNSIISGVSLGVAQVLKVMFDIIIGLFISVYCLNGRKTFSRQGKKVVYTFMKKEHADVFLKYVRFADKAFSEFISGKILEAFVVGIICFLGMCLIKTQYALLISVIIGVTNIIPFFGPIIGAIPSVIVLFFEDPLKCLNFIIFLIILVQIDANVLGPKIIGNSTGLSGFWIMFAIILFGGLFGIIGMLVGVPLFSVLYRIISDWINYMMIRRQEKS